MQLPTRFAEVMASRKATFMDSHFNPTWFKGSNGGYNMASSTRGRSHAGALRVLGGRSLRAPLRKRDTNLWHPTVAPWTISCREEIAAT